jgi:hypothetical protein
MMLDSTTLPLLSKVLSTSCRHIHSDSPLRLANLAVSLLLTGMTTTITEPPGAAGPVAGRLSSVHTFLKLSQPIDESLYPQPRIAEAGRTYTFPFTFVIPERLLPHVCRHQTNHPQVQEAHTRLPPSLGDPMLAGSGCSVLDDMAPHVCRIQYVVRAKLWKKSGTDGFAKTISERVKHVRVIPAIDEDPPLNVSDDSSDGSEYCMRKEKDVRRGALRKKIGRLVIAAAQPRAFQLRANASADTPTTMATVYLRFDPASGDQQPPRLVTLCSKLKVTTIYATEPLADFPSRTSTLTWNTNYGLYPHTVPLASRCVACTTWTKHDASSACPPARRPSVQSDSSSEFQTGPSAWFSGRTFYTTSVLVPITLPDTKTFVPTFHSCLVSRLYSLDLCLSYQTPNSSVTASTISLRIPVQLASRRENAAQEDVSEAQSADEFFTPRAMAPPRPEYTERAVLTRTPANVSSFAGSAVFQQQQPPPGYSVRGVSRQLANLSVVAPAG